MRYSLIYLKKKKVLKMFISYNYIDLSTNEYNIKWTYK